MAQNFKIIYSPEGGSSREWTVDLQNPAWDVMFSTEKATDWPWAVFTERLQNYSGIAIRALVWTLRKRTEPKLSIDAVQINMDEIDFAGQCPDCEAWVSTADGDDEHACARPAATDSTEEQTADPTGEA